MHAAVQALEGAGKQVIVIGPIPAYDEAIPRWLALNAMAGKPAPLGQLTSEFLARNRSILSTEWSQYARTAVVHTALCPRARCLIQIGGKSLYSDTHHLSTTGADYIAKVLETGARDPPGAGAR